MKHWEIMPKLLNEPRGFVKLVALNDKLYAVGGVRSGWHLQGNKKEILSSVEVFDGKE
jgi:hypothetical protein